MLSFFTEILCVKQKVSSETDFRKMTKAKIIEIRIYIVKLTIATEKTYIFYLAFELARDRVFLLVSLFTWKPKVVDCFLAATVFIAIWYREFKPKASH